MASTSYFTTSVACWVKWYTPAPLRAIPFSGGRPRWLTEEGEVSLGDVDGSLDGKFLAFTLGMGRFSWTGHRIAVLGMDLSSSRLTYLTETEKNVSAISPAFSPDGKQIAYVAAPDIGLEEGETAWRRKTLSRRIWTMKINGSDKRQLTNDIAFRDERPMWSANGSHILFARIDRNDQVSLWLMRVDGSQLKQVVKLSPGLDAEGGLDYYGHVSWNYYFDWWRGK